MASGCVEQSRHLLKQLSHQSSSESCVGEELELLTNVYFDELQITQTERGQSLSLHVTPSTADDKDKQFVYLDLTIHLPSQYPHLVPVVILNQSRGLSDAHLRGISEGLALKCSELLGSPMVYELVEYARECLTDNNLPCSHCAICQVQFQEGDDFTKTECYHYLHVACLVRYVQFFERERREMEREAAMVDTMLRKKPKQLECPVCRDSIAPGSVCLDAVASTQTVALHREDEAIHFSPSPELKAWQDRMASLLWKQKQKGGVINRNCEDDVIDETWVSSVSRKQNCQIGEDKETALAKEPTDNGVNGSGELTIDDVSRDMAEGQRTDTSRTGSTKASEKQGTGGRREGNRNGRISEKTTDSQRIGDRSKRTYDKQRYDQESQRRREQRENGRYRGRENGRHDQDKGREVRENGQGRFRGQRRDWQTSDGIRRGHQPESRDQRSKGARQGGGSRNADSAKAQSVPRRHWKEKHSGDVIQPGAGADGVKLKTRNTDIQDCLDPRNKTGTVEFHEATS